MDVYVSNTHPHPTSNIPADVQFRSEAATLSSGNAHSIHIKYGDPLFLAGAYYIGVYGINNSTFTITAITEQVRAPCLFCLLCLCLVFTMTSHSPIHSVSLNRSASFALFLFSLGVSTCISVCRV